MVGDIHGASGWAIGWLGGHAAASNRLYNHLGSQNSHFSPQNRKFIRVQWSSGAIQPGNPPARRQGWPFAADNFLIFRPIRQLN